MNHYRLEACPRCERPHGSVAVRRLSRPIIIGRHVFAYHAACPINGEPILMSESTKASAPSHDDIAILAYQLWQIDGYVHGRDRQHWLLAEEFLVRGEQLPEVMATNLGDSEEIAAHVAAIRNRLNTMEVPNDLGGDSHQWAADHGSERDAGQFATREES